MRLVLPEDYIITITYRKKDNKIVVKELSALVNEYSGTELDEQYAKHEWERLKMI